MDRTQLTEEVKRVAMQYGAALVGVAPIERFDPRPPYFDKAPKGHHPRDFVPKAMSVISISQPLMDGVVDAPAVLMDRELEMVPDIIKQGYLETHYSLMAHRVQDYMLEQIAQMVGQTLLNQGHSVMIFPTAGVHPQVAGMTEKEVWEGPSRDWADKFSPFRYSFGFFSHRHAATRAGLGEFGYNNIVLTKEYGPRQRFNSIITSAELDPSPLLSTPICLRDKCGLCLKACHMNAIVMRDDTAWGDYRQVDSVDKERIFIDTPAMTDAPICQSRKVGRTFAPVRGDCYRICPVPKVREFLPDRLQAIMQEWRQGKKV